MKKQRLDQCVFERGLTKSRERARTSIMAGLVFVDGRRMDKPGAAVSPESRIELRGEAVPYVSRGGLKREKALHVFGYDPEGSVCVDCGASTGGFTDVLLQNGAARVYAVDVGYGQLAWKLRNDPRVVCMERMNVRYVNREQIPEPLDLAVMDLSFISLRLVLPAVNALLRERGEVLCLVKPQFEAGREKVGKKGVVRDPAVHLEVLEEFAAYSAKAGFPLLGMDYSPIRGPEGNIEYLAHLRKGGGEAVTVPDLAAVVNASHSELKGHEND
jgi:23S rRNA (cytidine1920-2'-O)/16S rRNA (cytidine1409-2'-O)-methyltransferase